MSEQASKPKLLPAIQALYDMTQGYFSGLFIMITLYEPDTPARRYVFLTSMLFIAGVCTTSRGAVHRDDNVTAVV